MNILCRRRQMKINKQFLSFSYKHTRIRELSDEENKNAHENVIIARREVRIAKKRRKNSRRR